MEPQNRNTYERQYAEGKSLRDKCPRSLHAKWTHPKNRRDAVEMVLASEKGRLLELLPLRHGRMVRSAFTFYRGSALAMAADLSSIPSTGVRVQCCGDAHLYNFGGFATPERKIIFSINDLDETLPGPWEWDVKRLAASVVIACRDRGFTDAEAGAVAKTCVRAYRKSMAEFSQMRTLELWYYALEFDELLEICELGMRKRIMERIEKERKKSRAEEIFPKLVSIEGKLPIIKNQLPTIFHAAGHPPGKIQQSLKDAFAAYRGSLASSYQSLLDNYQIKDACMKVVGIGSVGTSCAVLLLMASERDPLFLQIKEARASVLEPYAGRSMFSNHGQRVVNGYRLMQPASDMFLGWSRGVRDSRDYFIRQLRDIKVSARVELFNREEMSIYSRWCGRALALSHARSGSSAVLSGYMGRSDTFDRAIAAFSVAYANQNESDHSALEHAVHSGKVKADFEEAR